MKPYYSDDTVTLWHGKNLAALPHIADGSIDCVCTSPPYFGLRSYLPEDHPDKADEYGTEETPAEFVANLVATFREIRRVLAADGTVWLNLGDSYSSKTKGSGGTGKSGLMKDGRPDSGRASADAANARAKGAIRTLSPGVPDKNLLGMPWRTAFALQDDGWILRNACVWVKPNAMPESVTDRLSTRYEMLFMFSKSRRYWFDLDPIREAALTADRTGSRASYHPPASGNDPQWTRATSGSRSAGLPLNDLGRNPGDVWEISTVAFPGSHFAVFPPEIPRRCILAGCKPGGTVLDPFHGSGTTGMVAQRLGRKYVGIELNRDYIDLSLRTRLADGALPFDEETA